MTSFGEKLKALRQSRFITQQKLANDLGISQSAIASYETNVREPSFAIIEKFANYFHVPFSSLTPSDASTNANTDEGIRISELLHLNPKLRLLFDRAKNFNEQDLDAVLGIVNAISRERDADD